MPTAMKNPPQQADATPLSFVVELIEQLLDDLRGVLAADSVASDCAPALPQPVDAGRVTALALLVRAALHSYPALRGQPVSVSAGPQTDAMVGAALQHLRPGAALPSRSRIEALDRSICRAEGREGTLEEHLAGRIRAFYEGLRNQDDAQSTATLLELRTMFTHLDAAAMVAAASLTPVVRPDRFHDAFLRYVEAARTGQDDGHSVAALAADGRITALVTLDLHPVAHAREALQGEGKHSLDRIEALLDAIQAMRQRADAPFRSAADDPLAFAALVTAAATAPLAEAAAFQPDALQQVMRYNLALLRGGAVGRPH